MRSRITGIKVTVMLEELLAAGHAGAEYDAWLVRIHDGEQFGTGFVGINPNSKIPALLDRSEPARLHIDRHAVPDRLAERRRQLVGRRDDDARVAHPGRLGEQHVAEHPGRRPGGHLGSGG